MTASSCCDYPTNVLRRLTETVEANAHESEATDTLFFFTVVLLIGVFTLHVLAKHVPYTALLLVRGRVGFGGGMRGMRRHAFFSSQFYPPGKKVRPGPPARHGGQTNTNDTHSHSHTHTHTLPIPLSFPQVWGLILGIAAETFASSAPLLGPGIHAWEAIPPDLLLAGFLPTLLYAGASALEWHAVRRQMPSSLLLAGPGVLVGTAATAALVKYTFPHSWNWPQCALFGAMFSATDPVAVVAVLKSCGLSKRLRTLVDLEALLNDGTAYVLFFILRQFVAGGTPPTAGETTVTFIRLAFGGVAVGLLIGCLTTFWLRYMYNEPEAEIMLTVVAAFFAYLVGDRVLKVSGVLAVVALGLWMSAFGSNHVSRRVEGSLAVVWDVLEYVANTVIFVLSGAVIASRIYVNLTDSKITDINLRQLPYALLLWVYLLLVRVFTFVIFSPLLVRAAYGLSFQDMVILSWSGLRGAVGLALSLFVLLDDSSSPTAVVRSFGVLCVWYMSAVAALTLLIQGVSMPWLLRGLGATKPPSVRRSFLRQLLRGVEARGDDAAALAASDDLLGDPDWRAVGDLSTLDAKAVLERYASVRHVGGGATPEPMRRPRNAAARAWGAVTAAVSFGRHRRAPFAPGGGGGGAANGGGRHLASVERGDLLWTKSELGLPPPPPPPDAAAAASRAAAAVERERSVAARLNRGALLAERRGRFLAAVRATYDDLFADAYINSSAVFYLRRAADAAADAVGRPLCDFDLLAPSLRVPKWTVALAARADWPGLARPAHAALAAALDRAAILLLAFIHAHDTTAADFVDVWTDGRRGRGGSAARGGLDDDGLGSRLAPRTSCVDALLDEMKANVARQVLAESAAQVSRAAAALARLRAGWPYTVRAIKTRQLAQALLLVKERRVADVARTGLLADAERDEMNALVEMKMKKLHFAPPRPPLKRPPQTVLRAHPLLRGLDDADAAAVVRASSLIVAQEGDALCRVGTHADAVVVILSGVVILQPTAPGGGALYAEPTSPPPSFARMGSAGRMSSGALGGRGGSAVFVDPPPPATAGAGATLFAAPVLLHCPHDVAATAASVVLAYRVPVDVLEEAMSGSERARAAAWRAAAVSLALARGGPALEGRPYADVDTVFRGAREEDVPPGGTLRVAGAAFLVTGRAARLAARGSGAAAGGPPPAGAPVITGPGVMLPPDPAVYSALERCRVLHMPAGSLDELADDGEGGGGDEDDDDGRGALGRRSIGSRPTSAFEAAASMRPPSSSGRRSASPPPRSTGALTASWRGASARAATPSAGARPFGLATLAHVSVADSVIRGTSSPSDDGQSQSARPVAAAPRAIPRARRAAGPTPPTRPSL